MATPICTNCGYYYAQWPHSSYCEFCAYQSTFVICSQCSINSATSVCLCAFPLPMFCDECSRKHHTSHEHSIQPISIWSMLKTREQYESHKIRIDYIDFVQGKLNVWCKAAVERANVELEATVKKLHSLLDAQFEKLRRELNETSEKIARICQCLEEMKRDYGLQSGTFFDEIVSGQVPETQLRSLESLFTYTANRVDPTLPILSSVVTLIDNIPDIHPERRATAVPSQNPCGYSNSFKGLETPIEYNCSICGKQSQDSCEWQVVRDGCYCCSAGCKKIYDSAFCQKCKQQITSVTWRSTALEDYPELADHFEHYCSLQCVLSSFPQKQKSQCVWCQVSTKSTDSKEIKTVQLDCLHLFHDVDCLIGYLASVSNNFTVKTIFVCPECSKELPFEVVKFAISVVFERAKTGSQSLASRAPMNFAPASGFYSLPTSRLNPQKFRGRRNEFM